MKMSFVSTQAIQNAMRLTVQRAQAEIVATQSEVVTGRHADVGLELGATTARSVSLNREVQRMQVIIDSNTLVNHRLTASQQALGQMAESAQQVLDQLIGVHGINELGRLDVTRQTVLASFESFSSTANTSANGEYLFAGINTDVKPLASYADGSQAKASFDAAFLAHFGFDQDDAAVASITPPQMDDFLTNVVEPLILGAGWYADWSSADDTPMTSRINRNEVVESSTTVNSDGVRNMAMASVIVTEMLAVSLSGDTRELLVNRAIDYAGSAVSGINFEQTKLGMSEQRISRSNESLSTQMNLMSLHIGELENVDVYEASTRLNTLLAQVETSYTLTARIQQLSLTNYL